MPDRQPRPPISRLRRFRPPWRYRTDNIARPPQLPHESCRIPRVVDNLANTPKAVGFLGSIKIKAGGTYTYHACYAFDVAQSEQEW